MQIRTFGTTALSFSSILVALYGMVGGLALLAGGSLGPIGGSGMAVTVLGALVFAAGVAAFFTGYGFWLTKHWAWAAGIVIYTVLLLGSAAMLLMGASLQSLMVSTLIGVGAISCLSLPRTRAVFLGKATVRQHAASFVQAVGPGSTDVATKVSV